MMQDMKMDPAQAQESAALSEPKAPEYPYGLRINLDDKGLEKMGIKGVPKAGTKFAIEAMAVVEDVHESQTKDGGGHRSVGLQITHLALDEDDEQEEGDAEKKLYGGDEGGQE